MIILLVVIPFSLDFILILLGEHWRWTPSWNLKAPWGTPSYKPYMYVPHQRVGFVPFWSENGIDFGHFGLELGVVFEGTTGVRECIPNE